jgi:hypothetical protein
MKTPPVFNYMKDQFKWEKFYIWTTDHGAMLEALKAQDFQGRVAGLGACITVPAQRYLFPKLAATVLGTDHDATMETETEVIDLSATGQNYGRIYSEWKAMHPSDLIPISADNRGEFVSVMVHEGGSAEPFTSNWAKGLKYFLVPTSEYPYPRMIGFVIDPAKYRKAYS